VRETGNKNYSFFGFKLDQVFSNWLLSQPFSPVVFTSQKQFTSNDTKLYANDGVFTGISPIINGGFTQRITVGVIAGSWPSWVYPFSYQSFEVKWILLVGDACAYFDDVYNQLEV
jgi:hypothetical protein